MLRFKIRLICLVLLSVFVLDNGRGIGYFYAGYVFQMCTVVFCTSSYQLVGVSGKIIAPQQISDGISAYWIGLGARSERWFGTLMWVQAGIDVGSNGFPWAYAELQNSTQFISINLGNVGYGFSYTFKILIETSLSGSNAKVWMNDVLVHTFNSIGFKSGTGEALAEAHESTDLQFNAEFDNLQFLSSDNTIIGWQNWDFNIGIEWAGVSVINDYPYFTRILGNNHFFALHRDNFPHNRGIPI